MGVPGQAEAEVDPDIAAVESKHMPGLLGSLRIVLVWLHEAIYDD